MGLDMFLTRQCKGNSDPSNVEEIMYWRKASAILNWFTHNLSSVQRFDKQVINTKRYEVTQDELNHLIGDCKRILVFKETPELIPDYLKPFSHFFFGSTLIDEYYWWQIESTAERLEMLKSKIDWKNERIEFHIYY